MPDIKLLMDFHGLNYAVGFFLLMSNTRRTMWLDK